MNTFIQTIAIVLVSISMIMSIPVMWRLRPPFNTPAAWGVKVFATALTPFFAIAASIGLILAVIFGSTIIMLSALYGILFFTIHLLRANAAIMTTVGSGDDFKPGWERSIPASKRKNFLAHPISWKLPVVSSSDYILQQDIPFSMVPGVERPLLCDIWKPATHIKPSGLAFIYFHGSAWTVLDKDFGTRTYFRHLVSQGHVIMDVAYRLFPETDMRGMVNDVYRAIHWMKKHANDYGVHHEGIIIGGASAGGHIALLAAYVKNEALVPPELTGEDLSVLAVISAYAPPDLNRMFNSQEKFVPKESDKKTKETINKTKEAMPGWVKKWMGKNYERSKLQIEPAMVKDILGCTPVDHPEVYKLFSPLQQVHKDCPDTLMIQGEHDLITPAEAAREMYERFSEEGVSALVYVLPQTDHAFDLVLPRIAPLAHTMYYVTERFLAVQAMRLNKNSSPVIVQTKHQGHFYNPNMDVTNSFADS